MNDLHLMPHQEDALNRTEQFNRCAYYLDMGLGKTFVGAEKMYLLNNAVNLVICQKSKYDWVEHEHCTPLVSHIGKRTIKTVYEYPDKDKYTYKSYRVFASNDQKDGRLLKRKQVKTKGEKFGNTPDHCFIFNDSVVGVKTPPELDRQWYIDLAKKRLKQFGVVA